MHYLKRGDLSQAGSMTVSQKRPIAIYNRVFLNYSQTFIYRQLLGVTNDFAPLVLTRKTANLDTFPYRSLHCDGGGGLGRWSKRLLVPLGKFTLLPSQRRHWVRLLRRRGVRMIHAHFGPSGIEILPVAQALNIPLLVTFHGYDASNLLRKPLYVRDLGKLWRYAHIIAVSRQIATRLLGLGAPPERLHQHYIGAPLDMFTPVARKALRDKVRERERIEFLQVSSFVPKKGHRYTVEAFRRLLQVHPACRLTLTGDGPLRASLEQLCQAAGIDDHVRFLGKVPAAQVPELMAQADVFLHHSITTPRGDQEGIPTVIMEAMAAGLVVISTRHAGIPELIDDGRDGFLVPERDVNAYVRCLQNALTLGPEMGLRAREKMFAQFDMEKQNRELVAIYHSLIDAAEEHHGAA